MVGETTHYGWPTIKKKLKLHWLKRTKTVLKKRNFDQKINDIKPHIWSLSINFKFFARNFQNQQKLAKKIAHFTIQFRSKNRNHFLNLNSLNIIKNTLQ